MNFFFSIILDILRVLNFENESKNANFDFPFPEVSDNKFQNN
jgi:hypothetical protein